MAYGQFDLNNLGGENWTVIFFICLGKQKHNWVTNKVFAKHENTPLAKHIFFNMKVAFLCFAKKSNKAKKINNMFFKHFFFRKRCGRAAFYFLFF